MPFFTVHYRFSQRFPFSAREVYDWSTDFQADDIARMGKEGIRSVERLDETTIILTDKIKEATRSITKVRLVKLYPEMMMWTNTRISEEGRHSQFIYQMVPEGKGSRLEFTGAQVDEAPRRPTSAKLSAIARGYEETDSLTWVRLAKSLEEEFSQRRSPGASGNRAH